MSINNTYTALARSIYNIKNPNLPLGTLLEEIPTDIGRTYAGYKRGGIIEGAEKLRRELMGAAVWIFGIPVFNKIGKSICENILKIPMGIDYSNAKDGRDVIKESANYLITGENRANLDVGELKKYIGKIKSQSPEQLAKNIKLAKQITSIGAVVLNCILMGIAIPKINQALTRKKMSKIKKENIQTLKAPSFDEFRNSAKSKNNISFSGKFPNFAGASGFFDWVVYSTENNNRFRLMVTDVPMIAGRTVTSRNKYEAFENFFMDAGSMYFYNFCTQNVEDGLRKLTNTPKCMPLIGETIKNADEEVIKKAWTNYKNNKNGSLKEILDNNEFLNDIYKKATYGKYGKINRFVKDSELNEIDNSVKEMFAAIEKAANKENISFINNNSINKNLLEKVIKSSNRKNALFLAMGLLMSIAGLAVIIPKLTFFLSKKISGKEGFAGIMDCPEEKNKN